MSTKSCIVNIIPGFSVFATALANSQWTQVANFVITAADGSALGKGSLQGKGVRLPMETTDNTKEYLLFGPFTVAATIAVTLSANNAAGQGDVSTMVGPITIAATNPDGSFIIRSDSVIAQCPNNAAKDDCIAVINQYKA